MSEALDQALSERRLNVARSVVAAQKATAAFQVGVDHWCPSRAVEKTIKQAQNEPASEPVP